MSFALSLAADVVEVEAGATSPVGLTVVNRGEASDRFEVEVEGIDPEWRFIPVPTFAVEPGESRSEKAFLKPPRLPESVSGSYPFVVRVRSLESGETRTAQALLKLNAFHSLTMDIAPKKGVVSPTTKRNDFRLTVVNLGNSEHTLQLTAQDPDDRCAYEFENDQIVLGPGQQREVELIADPKQTPLLSSGRLIGFSVVARSLTERNVSATAQAQLEQRSLLSPATLVAAALLAGAVGAWWTMRPVPPKIDLMVSPTRVMRGEKVQIRWVAQHADHVRITVGEDPNPVYDGVATGEPVSFVAQGDDKVTVFAEASREGGGMDRESKSIAVDAPPVVALPAIASFTASAKSIKVNTPVIVTWKATNATGYSISPLGKELGPEQTQLEIVPITAGKQVYTLYAKNSEGKTVSKTVEVEVTDPSEAAILAFSADPKTAREADGGRTTLSWSVTGAALVELRLGSDAPKTVEASGSQSLSLLAKTGVTLIATDAKGRRTARRLTVGYEKVPPPPPVEELAPKIKDALLSADGLESKGIDVQIVGKTVVLSGTVLDEIQKAQAGQIAGDVAGPGYTVDNQLTLSP